VIFVLNNIDTNLGLSNQYTNTSLVDYIDFQLPVKDLFAKAYALEKWIDYLHETNQYFYRRVGCGPITNRTVVKCHDGITRPMVMMGGNSYFELNNHPEVKKASIEAIEKYGTGTGGAPLLSGTFDIHQKLEQKLAEFKSCEAAMVFSSGFQTNYSLITGLLRSNDAVINDIFNHASIVEGCMGAKAKYSTYVDFFVHNNMRSLHKKLIAADCRCSGGKMVIVDGVFSMDGDIAKLPEICELARSFDAKVVVDDAHATGILGPNGKGTAEYFGLEGKIDLIVGTFSKTFGCIGGFIAGKKTIIDYLRKYAPGYIFSTSMAPGDAAAVLKSLEIIAKDGSYRNKLWHNTNYMHYELKKMGFNIHGSETPIIPIAIPNDKAWGISYDLQLRNVFINPIVYPAVNRKKARLRISLMASHTQNDLDKTLSALKYVGKKFGII
jgi:glycine C-acetyltransferase